MKCLICNSNSVVMSGIDAFCLGIPTEKYCYDCANYAKHIIADLEKVGAN